MSRTIKTLIDTTPGYSIEILTRDLGFSPHSEPQGPELLTPPQVAKYLNIALRTVYDWTYKGRLKPVYVFSEPRYRRADIETIITAKPVHKDSK
jgi:excisionase family DNA binding protein